MKYSRRLPFRPLAASIALVCAHCASGATYFWDGGTSDILTDGDGLSAGGAGTWNTAILNWDAGVGPHVAWPNLATDTAAFGGTAGVVTVGTAGLPGSVLNVGTLAFTTTGYTIGNVANNGTLAFGAGMGSIDASTLLLATDTVTINSRLTGTGGLTISGAGGTSSSGLTRLGGNNSGLSGGILLTKGGLTGASVSSFGTGSITISNGATLLATGTSLAVNNDITIGTGGANFRAYSTGMLMLNGVISDGTGASAFTIVDSGIVRLNGMNTYTGNTNINAGVISFGNFGDANGGNLGKAGNFNFNGGTLRYTGTSNFTTTRNITQSNNGTYEIVNPGVTVTMNGTTAGGVGGRFLNKTGYGTLVLGGGSDNNNGRFNVSAGTLVLGKASSGTVHAAGSQGGSDYALLISGGTAQLAGTGGDQIFNNSSVQMTGGNFDLNGRDEAIDSIYGTAGVISNTSATAATLTIGANNNNGGNGTLNNFSGTIRNGTGIVNLVKNGTGVQILTGANSYTGTTQINAGTLQLGNGGALGTGTITNNGTLSVTSTTGATLGTVGGTGAVTVSGGGFLTLAGTNAYTGTTTVDSGTLRVNGALASNVTINSGGTLMGNGSTTGTLFLNEGSTIVGGTSAITASSVTANFGGFGVAILVAGGSVGTNTVDVVKWGSVAGAPAPENFNVFGYRNGVVANDNASLKTTLTYESQAKTWNNAVTQWDTSASGGWTGGDGFFMTGDSVTFGDLAADTTVSLGAVAPSSTTVSNNTAFTLTLGSGGVGSIGGMGGLLKTGTGTLVLATPNTYHGQTIISAGTVKLGNSQGLGAAGVGNETLVSAGATLDVNGGLALNALATPEIIKIAGDGVGGLGAIVNSAAAVDQTNALAYVTLTGNASVGGVSRFDLRAAATGSPILDLAGFKLTKVGANLVSIINANITDGDIDINAGTFRVEGTTNMAGSGTVRVNSGATFSVYGNTGNVTRNIVMNTNGTTGSLFTNGSSNATIGSNILLNYAGNLSTGATAKFGGNNTTVLTGNISGTGSFLKTGAGVFVLAGNNTYAGYTLIDGGTLRLASPTALPSGTSVVLYSASTPTFDVNGYQLTLGTLTNGSASDTGNIVTLGSGGGKLTVTKNVDVPGINDVAGTFYGKFSGFGDIEYNNTTSPQGTWGWNNLTNDFTGNIIVTSGRLRYQAVDGSADAASLGNVDNDLFFNGTPVNTLVNGTGTASLQVTNGAAGQVSTLSATRTVTLNAGKEGTFYVWGGTTTNVLGQVTGGGILRKEDGGTLQLFNTANNWTGETRVVSGTLQLGAAGVIPDTSVVRIGDAGTTPAWNLNGFNETVAGLSSVQLSDSIVRTNGTVTSSAPATLTLNNSTNEVFGGAISGSVALVKNGAGMQTLSGSNPFTGPTSVNAGTLAVSGSLSGTVVTVGGAGILAGGTLATPGSIINGVTINTGGTLSPGIAGIGALNTGALSLNGGSVFSADIGSTTSDLVNVTGSLTLSGNINLTLSLTAQPVESTVFTLINGTGTLFGYGSGARFVYGLNSLDNGEIFTAFDPGSSISQSFAISYGGMDGNDVTLTAVPEPASAVMLLGGLASLAFVRRRRKASL